MHQYPGLQPALRLVAICSAFAAFGTVLASSPAMADAKLFAQRCAGCHGRAASLARRLDGNEQEKSGKLEQLLANHYAQDPDERARLIKFLIGLSR